MTTPPFPSSGGDRQRPAASVLAAVVPAILAPIIASTSAGGQTAAGIEGRPFLVDRGSTAPAGRFVAVEPDASGVDLVLPIDTGHPLKRLYTSALAGGGVAVGDLTGDDRPDLFFANGPGSNRLYRQASPWVFEDITATAGVGGGDAWAGGATLVDIEGDGDLDIHVCNYESGNQLFVNDGSGRFAERAAECDLHLEGAFLMAAFADYDRDGDLDVYLLGHRHYRERGRPNTDKLTTVKDGRPVMLPEYARYYDITLRDAKRWEINNIGAPDRLLRNDGVPEGGTLPRFVDATREAGLPGDPWQGNAVLWWDYNDDGWPDLFVANDFEGPDLLFRNNGNGTFSEIVRDAFPHVSWFSMGTDAGDIDNDGRMDLFTLDMAGTTHFKSKTTMGPMGANTWFMQTADPPQHMRNCLFVNTGTDRFVETAFLSGVAKTDWSWAARFGDLDHDGRLDLFVTNGVTRNFNDSDQPLDVEKLVGNTEWDLYEDTPPRREHNLAFRNEGKKAAYKFSNVAADWGLDHLGMSYGAAFGDLDGDGDLDLVVANLEEPVSLLRNEVAAGHSLTLSLVGRGANRFGIGATIRLESAGGIQVRQHFPVRGFSSCDQPLAHFGLGDDRMIDRLIVRWPDGAEQVLENVEAGRHLVVHHPGDAATPTAPPPATGPRRPESPRFAASTRVGPELRHWEHPFPDFGQQPLLPNALSRFGPALACGDVDGDGIDEFFLGGCAGELGMLVRRDASGRYRGEPFTAARTDVASEDMGAVFLDADADGDRDLFVVSGSVEAPPGHESFRDRLYLNTGRGRFVKASTNAVPGKVAASGSVACAADWDRDGDLDLFVGGRVVPGRYPETPESRLLRNRGDGTFEDAAPEPIARAGMVTSALWSDVDADGWIDLLVTLEWGPVKLFRNDEGSLRDATADAGLADLTGWWNGLAGADVDHDGDLDYLVTNFGLNTKYKASPEAPELLFYGDMDGSGANRIIEAGFEDRTRIPHRGFSCSSRAIPLVREKMQSYREFARATLEELYSPDRLEAALRMEAKTLESGILVNDGTGRFAFTPLPNAAQISPSFGCAVTELDGDGHPDLVLTHNFFAPQIETRPMDTGLGLMLRGDGRGGFDPVGPRESGILVPGDARSLVMTDLDDDGAPDLLVSQNDDQVVGLENRSGGGRFLKVRLAGPAGNPDGVGARVTLHPEGGPAQVLEVSAGSGYLGQSGSALFFGWGEAARGRLEVAWPDGRSTRHAASRGEPVTCRIGDAR